MNGPEATERLIALMRENDDIAHFADGCSEEMITTAEEQIGLNFPPSYRKFLSVVGTCDIAGEEFIGLYQTPGMGEKLLGSVSETLDARSHGLPTAFIVVMFDGMGGLIVLDTSSRDTEGEYPIRVWNPGDTDLNDSEVLGQNFGTYALNVSQKAVDRWRVSSD
ncbi:hypothetical protein GTY65_30710 [Streptomyces sp. SID8379]|uniref:SMI1/KNR4 family protein n=1 Tax=unclassified Streptomyces TaxID=2593676 RepID=UPI0009986197|nr:MULTISPECIES: SMI1/KNR4 family protein [unclassified Streptomyces]MYW68414.1 hypothetical protein [Streptomyces sp. SID8379]